MSQKTIFPPITYVLFSTFSLLRCHSLSFIYYFLSNSVSFPLLSLFHLLHSSEQIFHLTFMRFHFILVGGEALCSFIRFLCVNKILEYYISHTLLLLMLKCNGQYLLEVKYYRSGYYCRENAIFFFSDSLY